MNRKCKVISTYFGFRRFFPSGFEQTQKLIDEIISTENSINSGVGMDVIIVNHDFGCELAREYLNKINNTKTKNGIIKTINRPWNNGTGGSYASFSYAYELFKNDYYYWFFTEDDVILIADNYYQRCIDQLQKNKNVAFIGCNRNPVESIMPEHCHSGCGCTTSEFLNKAWEKHMGRLPYSEMPMPKAVSDAVIVQNKDEFFSHKETDDFKKWYREFELKGEVAFTNVYVELGFEIEKISGNDKVLKIYQEEEPIYV